MTASVQQPATSRAIADPPLWCIALGVWACVSLAVAIRGFFTYDVATNPHLTDFGIFYREGRAWLEGTALYRVPNMNIPTLTIVVLGPLAALPFKAAQATWTAVTIAALVAAVRLTARELRLARSGTAALALAVAVTHGTFITLWLGQTGGILCLLVTLAWRRYRRAAYGMAGVWIGLALLVKPSLAVAAVCWPWRVSLVAAATAITATGVSVAVTGLEPWHEWLRVSGNADWLNAYGNGSLMGAWARVQSGGFAEFRLADIHPLAWAVTATVTAGLGWCAHHTRNADRQFALALAAFLLISPLSWAHYALVLVGPVAALWRATRWEMGILALSAIPVWLFASGAEVIVTTAPWWLQVIGATQTAVHLLVAAVLITGFARRRASATRGDGWTSAVDKRKNSTDIDAPTGGSRHHPHRPGAACVSQRAIAVTAPAGASPPQVPEPSPILKAPDL